MKPLDIVIAIDASGSVMAPPFRRIRNFARELTRRFTSLKPTYFGLLHYNYRVIVNTNLAERIANTQTLRVRINSLSYLGQATLTQTALESAQTMFDNGARSDPDVEQILILFTDGRTYGGKQTLRAPLQRLRQVSTTGRLKQMQASKTINPLLIFILMSLPQSGVRVTVIAVGNEDYLDRYSLLLIADNQSNLVMIPTLENLGMVEKYLDRAAFMVCPK